MIKRLYSNGLRNHRGRFVPSYVTYYAPGLPPCPIFDSNELIGIYGMTIHMPFTHSDGDRSSFDIVNNLKTLLVDTAMIIFIIGFQIPSNCIQVCQWQAFVIEPGIQPEPFIQRYYYVFRCPLLQLYLLKILFYIYAFPSLQFSPNPLGHIHWNIYICLRRNRVSLKYTLPV